MLQEFVKRSAPLPPNSKLLILGGGFSGQRIAFLARSLGSKAICTRRDLNSRGADLAFDTETKIFPALDDLQEVTHMVSCIPPAINGSDPVLTHLKEELKSLPLLKWVGYLSTTGVYGDCKGEWVSEKNEPKPQQARSKRRLACEQAWQQSGFPVQILRLPGIYGPGRSALSSIRKGKSKTINKPGQVFSRIHVDDIAGATIHLINLAHKDNKPPIINIADNLPTSNIEVLRFAANLLGHSLPPPEPFESAAKDMSPMALSFWQENRKICNQMLCKELGYNLIYPDYKEGLKNCLIEEKLIDSKSNYE